DRRAIDIFRLGAEPKVQAVDAPLARRHLLARAAAIAQEVEKRTEQNLVVRRIDLPDLDDPFGARVRQRPEEKRVDQPEYGGGRTPPAPPPHTPPPPLPPAPTP